MKKITIIILLSFSIGAFAQITKEDLDKEIKPLTKKVKTLQSENSKLKIKFESLNYKFSNANKSIDSLRNQTQANSNAINQTSQELGLKISTTETNANQKTTNVDESLNKNSLYGIIGILSAILLSGLLYWLLSKRQQTDKIDLINQLNKTKSSIEESLVKEFGKQTELMSSQLYLIEQQKTTLPVTEPDHLVALIVANNIVIIERSIEKMDESIRGLQKIKNSITDIKDFLTKKKYGLPELLGKPFNKGMIITVKSSVPNENLKKGEELISKIFKPQVNYNDIMIQAAEVEVSVGY